MGRRFGRGIASRTAGKAQRRDAAPRVARPDRRRAGPDPEADLLRRMSLEDESALIALYETISPAVHACCLRILRDEDEAKDATAETFWRLWTRADRYDPERCSAMAWILTVTRRLALDRRRSNIRRGDVLDRVQREPRAAEDWGTREEARLEIETALERLSGADRQLLESAYFEGLSGADIAARDDLPLGTVKSRMRAAMKRLRIALNGGSQ